jgi:hypothetical protein
VTAITQAQLHNSDGIATNHHLHTNTTGYTK